MFEHPMALTLLGLLCLGTSCQTATSADLVSAPAQPLTVTGSLAEAVWTNYVARTNGRTMALWSEHAHPTGWPTSAAPAMVWNPQSLITAYSNYTGISQCWEGEGNRGQVPMTLLTRRHAYTRGHHTGAPSDGQAHFQPDRIGKKVWFVTPENQVIEARIAHWLTRLGRSGTNGNAEDYCDYSLVIFSNDLPASLSPLKVMTPAAYRSRVGSDTNWPRVLFQTEQGGNVSSGIPPFTCDTWKGGDSGSPDLVPLGHWLVFIGGRSTTGPTEQMQADIDRLTRSQGLATNRYQLDWIGLAPRNVEQGARR